MSRRRKCCAAFALILLMFLVCVASAENVSDMSLEELEQYIADLQKIAETKEKVSQESQAVYMVEFEGRTYAGTYDGEMTDGTAHGTGRFEGNADGDTLIYEGQWERGQIKGEGSIKTDVMTIYFDDAGEVFTRTSTYEGSALDGKPQGVGEFSAVNSADIKWDYWGEWEDGMMQGVGIQTWHEDEPYAYVGTFTSGNFTPTWTEAVCNAGALGNLKFDVSDVSGEFMDKYPHFFKDAERYEIVAEAPMNYTFDVSKFKKNPAEQAGQLVRVYGATVAQIFADNLWGIDCEIMLFVDDDETIYYGLRQGTSDIIENMKIDTYVLPVDWVSYKNIEGKTNWAVFCVLSSYMKESFDTLKVGSKGSDVMKMKTRLQELGYFTAGAKLSESYNSVCAERVKQFQENNGISPTGIADEETLRLLYSDEAKGLN